MRILLKAKSNTGNALYRWVLPMSALLERGHEVRSVGGSDKPVQARDLAVDVLQVHRYCDKATQALMRRAQEQGAVVVWDDDDDVLSFRDTLAYRQVSRATWERRRADINRAVAIADLVTTPNAVLGERFQERGARAVAVIENYVPGLFLEAKPQSVDGVTIGWVGGVEHLYDADQLQIRKVLQRVLDSRPEVRVVTIGLPLRLHSERYEHISLVPLVEMGERTRHGGEPDGTRVRQMLPGLVNWIARWDVAIAPLAEAPFNTTRSNVKLKEYAAAGVPWLASPVGPYVGMGEAQGGRLVAHDRWYEELSRLLDKPRDRRKLAKRARKWAAGETMEKNAHLWEAAFESALAGGARRFKHR